MIGNSLLNAVVVEPRMAAIWSDRSLLAAMLEVEAALAEAQAALGLAPHGLAAAIRAVPPEAFEPAAIAEGARRSAVPTIAFLAQLEARLPSDLAWALHRGATSQDLLDTALSLLIRRSFRLLAEDLAAALDGFAAMAERYDDLLCLGRTYGQAAAPITFGARAGQWAAGLAEPASELPELLRLVPAVSLGGPVGTVSAHGDAATDLTARFAALLGLVAEPLAWHARRWRIARTGAWLAGLIGTAAKIARDLAELRSDAVAEVAERGGEGRGGSSAMPHKRNPAGETAILAAHHLAPGLASALIAAMAVAEERGGGGWQAEWQALPGLFSLASRASAELARLAAALRPDEDRMRANLAAARGLIFADRAAEALAPRVGRKGATEAVARAANMVRSGTAGTLAEALRAVGHAEAAESCTPDAASAAGARSARAAARRVRDTASTLRRIAGEGREE
ncbi:MAG: lyase family protein [Elioraea sp.]|nr:lyase family protein [Elioraea sp.]